MTVISRKFIAPHLVSEMFRLVDDIGAYPEFLPWCRSASELFRSKDEVRATVEITHAAFHRSYTILHRLQQDKMIELRLVDGPFKHFEGFWRFESHDHGCKVCFDLEFRFANKFLGFTLGALVNQVAGVLMEAFIERAEQVYSKR